MKNLLQPLIGLLIFVLIATAGAPLGVATAHPGIDVLDTTFTYQGHLRVGNALYTGMCDFGFSLWDDPTGGAQIGTINEKTEVAVADGLFAVTLDFGQLTQASYLEVSVRCPAGSGEYTALSPRDPQNPAPYAMYALASPWSGITGIPTGFSDNVDDDTIYSAGSGLNLADTTFSVDEEYLGEIISTTLVAEPEWFTNYISLTVSNTVGVTSTWFTTVISTNIVNHPEWFTTMVISTVISNQQWFDDVYQSRITGTCGAGSSIRQVNTDGSVVCEADSDTIYAAGSGLTLTGGVFSVNTTTIQARITGTCGTDSSIRQINTDGSVVCETDDNTTYTAGSGVSLSGTTFSINTSTIQARITGVCSAESSIRVVNSNGTVSCESDTNTTYTAGDGIGLSGTTFSAAGTPYDNVVIVAKSGGDYDTITAAMTSITDAGSSNRYLVWVAPGVYNERVTMKQYVDLQGAGQEVTKIASTAAATAAAGAVITGDATSTIRDLTISFTGTDAYGVGVYGLTNGIPSMSHVTISVGGGQNRYGVYAGGSTTTTAELRHLLIQEASPSGSSTVYGVRVGGDTTTITMVDSVISIIGGYSGATVYGVAMESTAASTVSVRSSLIYTPSGYYALDGGTTSITLANNTLVQGIYSGSPQCFGNMDEAGVFYTNTCP